MPVYTMEDFTEEKPAGGGAANKGKKSKQKAKKAKKAKSKKKGKPD